MCKLIVTRLDIADAAPPKDAESFEVDVRACDTRRLKIHAKIL